MAKRDVDYVMHRESELHVTLRHFALPTDPKVLAKELSGRAKDAIESSDHVAKLEAENKALRDTVSNLCMAFDD